MILTTKPIPIEVIQRIKEHLSDMPRELAWLQLSLNTAFRGGDILKLLRSDIVTTPDGHTEIQVREQKTKKIRTVRINGETLSILQAWFAIHPRKTEFLFEGQRGQMRTSFWSVKLKEWCNAVGYTEPRTATHSLRKSFCRIQHEKYKVPLYILSHALNHSSENQTRTYMGLLAEGLSEAFNNVI